MSASRRGVAGLGWLVVCLAAGVTTSALWPMHGLAATYFPSPTWSGRPQVRRIDPTVTSALLAQPPATDWQTYSVEWSGSLIVVWPGDYTFGTRSDDGSEVWLGASRLVDNSGVHGLRLATASVRLTRGIYPLQVRYAQQGGRYACDLLWALPGQGLHEIPTLALVPDAPSVMGLVVRHLVPFVAAALLLWGGRWVIRKWAHAPAGAVGWWTRVVDGLDRPAIAVAALCAVGGMARLGVLVFARPIVWPDSTVFYLTAQDILRGRFASHEPYRTLAYPFVLAAAMAGGEGPSTWTTVVGVQQVLGLGSAAAFFLIGRHLLPPPVAFGGGLAFAAHGLTLFYEASILTEALFTAVLAATCWLAMRALPRLTIGRAMVAGAACGALVLVRPVAQWYVATVVLAMWTTPAERRTKIAASAAALIACGVVVWPMTIINARDYGFRGVSLGAGMGLYTRVFEVDALAPPAATSVPEVRDLWVASQALGWSANRVRDELDYAGRLSTAAADQRMYRLAAETVRSHPWAFAWGSLRQWVAQVVKPEAGAGLCGSGRHRLACSSSGEDPKGPFRLREPAAMWLRSAVAVYLADARVPMAVPFALALAGAAALLRFHWSGPACGRAVLFVLTAVYFTVVPALSQWPQDRYRLPVDALWFMLALNGAAVTAPRLRQRVAEHRTPVPLDLQSPGS